MNTTPLPRKPTGKLAFAYNTIASLEQARADLEAENAALRADAELWRTHKDKLDALIAFCPTCCAGFAGGKEMTRDEVLFACGKAAGKAEITAALESTK